MGLPLSDALAPLHEAPRGDVQQQVRVLWGGVLGGVRGIPGLKRRPRAPRILLDLENATAKATATAGPSAPLKSASLRMTNLWGWERRRSRRDDRGARG